jgi:hypothetical protein
MSSLYMRHGIQGETFNPSLHYFTHKNVKTWKFLMIAYRYQSGNQNLYIEEEQPTQWPKEKV